MFSYMESVEKLEKVYTPGNTEGVSRVLRGDYAFLMESVTLDYYVNQYCNLTQVGNLLDRKGYGIALKQGSPYTSLLSNVILKLQEEQYLKNLRNKWFMDYPAKLRELREPHLSECPKLVVASSGAKEMEVQDVGGVFIVLIAGLLIGILFSLVEIWWKAKKIARHEREPVCTLIWREFYRTLTLSGSTTTTNPLLITKSSSNANVASSSNLNARTSIAQGEDQKTLPSAKDLDNLDRQLQKNRSRSNTGLSKKGTTNTTLNTPQYNLSMNTIGLPSAHRDSYQLNNLKDFDDLNLLNNSIDELSTSNPIIQPPPGFDNDNLNNTNVKQSYDHYDQQQASSFLPQAINSNFTTSTLQTKFEPFCTNGLRSVPFNSQQQLNSSINIKPKSSSQKKSSTASNFNNRNNLDINDNNLRRRGLAAEPINYHHQPISAANNYDNIYE